MDRALVIVMAVPLVTWLGIFAYLFKVDTDLRRLERRSEEQDDL